MNLRGFFNKILNKKSGTPATGGGDSDSTPDGDNPPIEVSDDDSDDGLSSFELAYPSRQNTKKEDEEEKLKKEKKAKEKEAKEKEEQEKQLARQTEEQHMLYQILHPPIDLAESEKQLTRRAEQQRALNEILGKEPLTMQQLREEAEKKRLQEREQGYDQDFGLGR